MLKQLLDVASEAKQGNTKNGKKNVKNYRIVLLDF